MSASLNHEKFAKFFGSCPVLEIPGRSFPVKTVYCNHVGKDDINTPNYLTKVSIMPYSWVSRDVIIFTGGQLNIDTQSWEGIIFSLYVLTLYLAASKCNFVRFVHSSTT